MITDMNSNKKIIYLHCVGGQEHFTSYTVNLAPKVGPLGLSPRMVAEEIIKQTQEWKHVRVKCKVVVQDRSFRVEIMPSCASYIIRALNQSMAALGCSASRHVRSERFSKSSLYKQGNLSMEQVFDIARKMKPRSRSKELKGCVQQVLGTCVSIGCQVECQDPKQVQLLLTCGVLSVPLE
ncbi:hypothetical protein C9374_010471 [Naegleria lovaniensis]|uniref:Ribosomal protein L11 n=1 Tax=Naegleria lovaniensis TaxID=51637 RepID=A0AA88GFN4_NAELO|nr:uncharacterized protein C9374_010471 [Naegleria lovaniensis]KAG2374727.1 hypothetical protein C9374_010471 [Naegleria lovaniensis]